MILTGVELVDVRNYAALTFTPPPGLTVLLGDNAQGKSNLLEAIAMLATGKSFRTTREAELVRDGCQQATITGEAHVRAGEVRLSCVISAGSAGARKAYAVNGERVRYTSFLGRARVVTFTPADLQLVAGPPALRRSLLNAALAQETPRYYRLLADYSRTLTQKNAVLRGAVADENALLDTYDERLAELGAPLMLERAQYVQALAGVAATVAQEWAATGTPREGLEVRYAPNVTIEPGEDERAIVERLRAAFAARRPAERARGQALVGPQRDDLAIRTGGRSLAAYGSQGEQRTAVLALKVAEYTVMRERVGEAPLLVLDDVLSELDAQRQRAFLANVSGVEQAFLSSAAALPPVPIAATYRVASATLTRL
ncbi:MAG TPA: DNA replication and repair protein RecF [Candidatus Baltobacteraceae bacterium]